jgi:flagellar motor component MotA
MEIRDLFFFDKMIVPKIITFIYWLALLGCVLGGLFMMTQDFLTGLAIVIGGSLAARIYAELMMVFFKMNEALQEIRTK